MRLVPFIAVVSMLVGSATAIAGAAPDPGAQATQPNAQGQQFRLYDGSTVTLGADGLGTRTDAHGHQHPFAMVLPQGHTALGDQPGPSRTALLDRLTAPPRSGPASDVVVQLSAGTVDGKALGHGRRAAHTTDSQVNAQLHKAGADTMTPLVPPATPGLPATYLVHVSGSAVQAAATLRATPGVSYAAPDQYVSPFDTDPVPVPKWVSAQAAQQAKHASTPATATLPGNFGLQSVIPELPERERRQPRGRATPTSQTACTSCRVTGRSSPTSPSAT